MRWDSAFWVIASLLLAACHSDLVYRHYPTHAAAVAAGEQQRGWLPDWVPSSAVDLHLENDMDSNEWWLRFELPGAARESLIVALDRIDPAKVRVSQPWRVPWFEGLIQKQPANDAALYAELFQRCCDQVHRTVVLAFDRNSPTVYVWTQR